LARRNAKTVDNPTQAFRNSARAALGDYFLCE
jgi:hypothetical protein